MTRAVSLKFSLLILAAMLACVPSASAARRTKAPAKAKPVEAPVAAPAMEESDTDGDGGWRLSLTPYLWATKTKSEMRVGPVTAKSTVKFVDAVEMLNYTFIGNAELRKGRWSLISDTVALGISEGAESKKSVNFRDPNGKIQAKLRADVSQDLLIQEVKGTYRIFERKMEPDSERRFGIDAVAGIRYLYMDNDVQTKVSVDATGPGGNTVSRSTKRRFGSTTQFVDPLVGARVVYDVTDRLAVAASGDVGGFGVGSDSALSGLAYAKYQLSKHWSVLGGYKYLYMDYDGGSDGFTNTYEGPVAALTYSVNF